MESRRGAALGGEEGFRHAQGNMVKRTEASEYTGQVGNVKQFDGHTANLNLEGE